MLIYKKLGAILTNSCFDKKLNILDIGSGNLMTAQNLVKDTSFIYVYTAIDYSVDAIKFAQNIKPFVNTFEYQN